MRKTLGIGLTVLAAAAIWVLAGSSPQAFHSGGVAECGGCHSMHAPAAGGSFLLIESDPSSTCLSCHENPSVSSYHIATPDANMPVGTAPLMRTPGGDFGWLHKTYTFSNHGTNTTETGDSHGHNIVSEAFGFTPDEENTVAPGGTFPAEELHCTSCHDPHGRVVRTATGFTTSSNGGVLLGSGSYNNSPVPGAGQSVGAYRLLKGLNDVTPNGTFVGVAIAVAPSTYNQSEATNQVRVAYGSDGATNTWGTWCASCHPDMHSNTNYVHPIDQSLGSGYANNYNAYVKTGDMSGSIASSYSSLVPFAENTGDFATLAAHASNTNSYLNGPGPSDKVMCLSCHRAHASGFMEMLRWNFESEFMIYNSLYPGTDNAASSYARGKLAAETQAAYYDRPVTAFASYQRVLCNKCHAKD
jgi:hypothetical protein